MNACPCCSHQMLRHIRYQQVYWFCRSCWQEMPLLEQSGAQRVCPNPLPHRTVATLRSLMAV